MLSNLELPTMLEPEAQSEQKIMIDSISIKNFKCFKELSLFGLGSVNVVVGDNAAGKTALLEAIYLSQFTTPLLVQKLKTWRGLATSETKLNREGYESVWRDLFFGHNQELTIELTAKGTPENERRLRAFYNRESDALPLIEEESGIPDDSSVVIPITFEVTDSSGARHDMQPAFGPIMPMLKPGGLTSLAALYCSTYATAVPSEEAAKQFSALNKRDHGGDLESAVNKVFPRVSKLSVEEHCGLWLLHCKVDEVPTKIPVNFVSSGVHKLIALLAGIASQENGLVLVDEIDNGFYYKILPDVWSVLHSFAKKYNTQLIVSTHSKECLNAILPTIRKKKQDFRLVRVEVNKAKKHVAKVFDGDDFEAAVSTATEIR